MIAKRSDNREEPGIFSEQTHGRRSRLRLIPLSIKMVWQAYPRAAVAIPLIGLLLGACPVCILYCGKRVIDGVILWSDGTSSAGRQMVLTFLGAGLALSVLQHGLNRLSSFLQELLRLRLTRHIQGKILQQASRLDLEFFETPGFYDKLQRAQCEVGFRPYAVVSSIFGGLRQSFTLCSYAVTLATLALWSAPYLIVAALPSVFVQVKLGRQTWRVMYDRTHQERRMHYYQSLLTSSRHAKEIRLFGLARYLIDRWQDVFRQFYRKDRDLAKRRNMAQLGVAVYQTAASAGFYAFAIYRTVTDPAVTIGSLFMYHQSMERGLGSMRAVFQSVASLYDSSLYLGNLFDYLALRPRISSPAAPRPVPRRIRYGLRFESVTFRYPGATENALEDVSFEIRPGQKVAFIGKNGSGKTTIVKLLARLYDPQDGRIVVDGTDLRELDPEAWQRQIAAVFQDFGQYWVTARENVGFGQLEHVKDMERIRAAADGSGARECIEQLVHGWESVLGRLFDEGQELSFGQWQRVALARALVREAPILVLDEPTAAIDPQQEQQILKGLDTFAEGKITVLVSHRPSAIRLADRIFVIDHGRLVGSGDWDDLMAPGGQYAGLFGEQATVHV